MYFPFLIILKLCNDREILILWWRLHRKGGRIENIPIHQGISSEKRTKRKKEEKKNVRCGTKCIGSSQIASIRLHNSLTAAAASSQCFSLLSFFFYLWLFNLGGNCLHSSVILQHIVCKCFPSLFFSLLRVCSNSGCLGYDFHYIRRTREYQPKAILADRASASHYYYYYYYYFA